MTNYNYLETMVEDIKDYIKNNPELDRNDLEYSRNDLEEKLHDDLWAEDSITGNASGSYTFNNNLAKEYVLENIDLLHDAVVDFCLDYSEIGEKFINEEWEYLDVTIRCNLLSQAISQALNEIEEELEKEEFKIIGWYKIVKK